MGEAGPLWSRVGPEDFFRICFSTDLTILLLVFMMDLLIESSISSSIVFEGVSVCSSMAFATFSVTFFVRTW